MSESSPAWDHRPSLRSRVVHGALRAGLHPIMHHVPGKALPIKVARAALDRAAVLIPTGGDVRVERVRDPRLDWATS